MLAGISEPMPLNPMSVANAIVTGPGAASVPVLLVPSWLPSSMPAQGGIASSNDVIADEQPSNGLDDRRAPSSRRGTKFSLTIGCTNNVIPGWLDVIEHWFQQFTESGLASLEVGPKNGHLHIQAIFCKLIDGPVSAKTIEGLRKSMKGALGVQRGDGIGCKITLKPFAPGQEWEQMLAYCTKEAGAFHCHTVRWNVSDAEIQAGRMKWSKAKLSYEDGKTVLYKKNLFGSTYNFKFVMPAACASHVCSRSASLSLSLFCEPQEIAGAWHSSRRIFLCDFD